MYMDINPNTQQCACICNNNDDCCCSYIPQYYIRPSVGGQTSAIQKQREVSDGLHIIIIVQLCYCVTRASRRPPSSRAGDRRPEKSEQTAVEHTTSIHNCTTERPSYIIIITIIERSESKTCILCNMM